MLSHGTDMDSKSHLVLNEKDSPPYHPGETKFSQYVFQANGKCHLCCCCSSFRQRHQNQRSKEREKKNLLASISYNIGRNLLKASLRRARLNDAYCLK